LVWVVRLPLLSDPDIIRETFRAASWYRKTFLRGNHRAITIVADEKESPQAAARPRRAISFTLTPAPAPCPTLAQTPPNTRCEESRPSPCLVSAGRRHAEGSACSSSTTAAARRSPHQRLQEPVDLTTPVSRAF